MMNMKKVKVIIITCMYYISACPDLQNPQYGIELEFWAKLLSLLILGRRIKNEMIDGMKKKASLMKT